MRRQLVFDKKKREKHHALKKIFSRLDWTDGLGEKGRAERMGWRRIGLLDDGCFVIALVVVVVDVFIRLLLLWSVAGLNGKETME